MMYTGSEDLEDLVRGPLRSGRILESKLQRISLLKNAIQTIEFLPQKENSINEAPGDEDEESQAINRTQRSVEDMRE